MIDLNKIRNWTRETQAEFCKRTGIDQGGLSRIERGVDSPSVKLIERVLAALTPSILFIAQSPNTPAIINAMLALGQIDTVEHEPDAFDQALRRGMTIAVVTDDKEPFEAMIQQALNDSGLPEIPQRGIRFEEGKAVAW